MSQLRQARAQPTADMSKLLGRPLAFPALTGVLDKVTECGLALGYL